MQMTEDVVMHGAQLLAVVILLGCRLVQMPGGSALAVHLQEVVGTGRAGMVEEVTIFFFAMKSNWLALLHMYWYFGYACHVCCLKRNFLS
jgi:hypothetical protein